MSYIEGVSQNTQNTPTDLQKNPSEKEESFSVQAPREFDVIKGRGNGANLHPGNVSFRKIVSAHKDAYYVSSNDEKKKIVYRIIQLVQASNPPGRFLTEDAGVWKPMDQRSIFRKVGQALREHQVRLKEADLNRDKPPKVININAPAGQSGVSLNTNSKRGIEEFPCDIRNAHKLPKMGGNIHQDETQNYRVGMVREEMSLLKEQVLLLSKRVAFLEKNINDREKNSKQNDRNLSYAATRSLFSPRKKNLNGLERAHDSTNCIGSVSTDSTQSSKKSLGKKASLLCFSQALTASVRGITKLDDAEDILFTLLTKSTTIPGESKL